MLCFITTEKETINDNDKGFFYFHYLFLRQLQSAEDCRLGALLD